MLAGILIVFLIGTGTSYAAEGALPGDILYPVKTSVNKSIRGALTVSEEAKTLWSATLAVRRLEEAGVLAIEGRLTDSTRADIESRLDKHVEDFKMRTDSLAQAEDKTEAVADAQSYFETTLKAHTSVLAELSAVNPEAEQELRPILAVARAYADTVEKARTATERVITLKAGRNVQERAFAKKKEAENEYLTIRSRPSVSAVVQRPAVSGSDGAEMSMNSTLEHAPAPLDPVLEAFNTGTERFDEGEYDEAFTAFQEVLRNVQEEKIKHNVRKRLKLDIDAISSDDGERGGLADETELQYMDSKKPDKDSSGEN